MAINPLQGPIDYLGTIPQVDLTQRIAQGFQLGAGIRQAQEQRAAVEAAAAAKRQYATDLQATFDNPTQAAFARLAATYPQNAAAFKQASEGFSADRLKNEFNGGLEISNALENGKPEVAKQALAGIIAAKKNSGEPLGIYQQAMDALDGGDVQKAQAGINLALSIADPDKFIKLAQARTAPATAANASRKGTAEADAAIAAATIAQANASNATESAAAGLALAKANADKAQVDARFAEPLAKAQIQNIKSQVSDRLNLFGLKKQELALRSAEVTAVVAEKMASIGNMGLDIPKDVRASINEASTLAATSSQSASQFFALAAKVEQAGGGSGIFTTAGEFIKRATGGQGDFTMIRNEYTRVRNSIAIKSLPPGVATDKDIQLALKGLPPETADAKFLASFLKGMAKMQNIDSAVSESKTDWLQNNNGLLTKARSDFSAGSLDVKKGESFTEFAERVIVKMGKSYEEVAKPDPSLQIPAGRAGGAAPSARPAAAPSANRNVVVDY
jgi:hypothetical protein